MTLFTNYDSSFWVTLAKARHTLDYRRLLTPMPANVRAVATPAFACAASRTPADRRRRRLVALASSAHRDGDQVVVVGAGVIGLSCALALRERGIDKVSVVAEKMDASETTSGCAGAWWYPFLVEPASRTDPWALTALDWFVELARGERAAETGVTIRRAKKYLRNAPEGGPPEWTKGLDYFREMSAEEAPSGVVGVVGGYEFDAPVVEMPKFLAWLRRECEKVGVTFERRRLESLDNAIDGRPGANVVVNCSGLGARELAEDDEVVPVRGHVIYVSQDSEYIYSDDGSVDDLAYIIPRDDYTVLGGTAQVGRFDTEPCEEDARDIVRKCKQIWPALDERRIVGARVGLRPSRKTVRLELDDRRVLRGGARVIHCFGHGGAGVTLCRGSALEVADIVASLFR